MQTQQTPPLKDIAAAIKVSGISKIDLSMDEVKLIVTTLVYDGLLEEVRGAVSRFNRDVSEDRRTDKQTHTRTERRAPTFCCRREAKEATY